jgi:hypothetical protein
MPTLELIAGLEYWKDRAIKAESELGKRPRKLKGIDGRIHAAAPMAHDLLKRYQNIDRDAFTGECIECGGLEKCFEGCELAAYFKNVEGTE